MAPRWSTACARSPGVRPTSGSASPSRPTARVPTTSDCSRRSTARASTPWAPNGRPSSSSDRTPASPRLLPAAELHERLVRRAGRRLRAARRADLCRPRSGGRARGPHEDLQLDLGYAFGQFAELRLGLARAWVSAQEKSGVLPEEYEYVLGETFNRAGAALSAVVDRLDSATLPKNGSYVQLTAYESLRRARGGRRLHQDRAQGQPLLDAHPAHPVRRPQRRHQSGGRRPADLRPVPARRLQFAVGVRARRAAGRQLRPASASATTTGSARSCTSAVSPKLPGSPRSPRTS